MEPGRKKPVQLQKGNDMIVIDGKSVTSFQLDASIRQLVKDREAAEILRQVIKSRSMAKRIAIQKGEPFPGFNAREKLNAERVAHFKAEAEVASAKWVAAAMRWNREVDDA